jgi:hydrogenase nickel incorporation protein HypB
MCDTCGCNITPGNKHLIAPGGKLAKVSGNTSAVDVLQNLLSENDHQAAHNRAHFDKHNVLAINLMSSPGSGKTSLLERTIESLHERYRFAVIEGDLETENDAERIRAKHVPAVQITTGNACHLDAHMVHEALHQLDLNKLDIVFIENVGNLVCPASFDLGQHRNITLLSVTEGDDKPAKYPVMFRASDAVLLTKTDLLAVLDDFNPAKAKIHVRHLANDAPVINVSSRKSGQADDWFAWLEAEFNAHRQRLSSGRSIRPKLQADGIALHRHEQLHSQQHSK